MAVLPERRGHDLGCRMEAGACHGNLFQGLVNRRAGAPDPTVVGHGRDAAAWR